MRKITISVIGAGSRGADAYAKYALAKPELCSVAAVAEPRGAYREAAARMFGIPEENVFRSWEDFAARPKMSDAVLIATPDSMHAAPALACIERGYDILLEKPMAPTAAECRAIVAAAKRKNCVFAVCHVLRYTAYFRKLREIIDSGAIGEIRNIRHTECVGYWHYAHSYVRGNWRSSKESSPMILAKCCHDTDILLYLTRKKCRSAASFGGRSDFCREKQPAGAADRCQDCKFQESCLYAAPKFYLRHLREGNHGWPTNVVVSEFTGEALTKAMREGPYGRCVYACDNDVVEQQSLALEFEGNCSAVMTMTAFTEEGRRYTDIYGTLGELHGDFRSIVTQPFGGEKQVLDVNKLSDTAAGGHGGGDMGLAADFAAAVASRDQSKLTSGPDISLESHLIAFAAEESRLTGKIVRL